MRGSAAAGTIAPEELRHILSTFGEPMDSAEIDEYLAEADLKCPDLRANGEKTGLINYFAFVGEILDIPQSESIPVAAATAVCAPSRCPRKSPPQRQYAYRCPRKPRRTRLH